MSELRQIDIDEIVDSALVMLDKVIHHTLKIQN
jgi:hypothetical protein